LPTIAVRDLNIQKRENDLVVGTFGAAFTFSTTTRRCVDQAGNTAQEAPCFRERTR
jgi:hypothetical protein